MPDLKRRQLLAVGATLPLLGAGSASAATMGLVPTSEFPSVQGITYLNAAQKHPLSLAAAQALRNYADMNLRVADGGGSASGAVDKQVLAAFSRLINADPDEVSFVPSTMSAENLILAALGFPRAKGNIVTDDLHYDGSIYLYQRLARAGVEVRQVPQRGGRVSTDELVRAMDANTRLIAISLVSFANGFEHDLPAICAAAHRSGALVYADIIQAAGATPVDVRSSNVDFAAAGTHKWMMGDKGLGFLYVRRDLLESGRIEGVQYGWKQIAGGDFMIFDDGREPAHGLSYTIKPGTVGEFEVGTYALGPMACVATSLAAIEGLGVPAIRAHASTLGATLREALPRLGYPCLSPPEAAPHVSAFRVADKVGTQAKLLRAGIHVRLTQNFMRVSTSIYNTSDDVERIKDALA